ncbi:MAG: twin-arginine translocase TatA/TatE family subunit [Prevotella sp.]|nr:twin-arginine translocase TatA/TatE family subunit [Prevotella sp.]
MYTALLIPLNIGYQEILIIALIILLLFGGRKIPELMKGLGKGMKSFKDGMNGIEDDADNAKKTTEKVEEDSKDK